MVICSFFQKKMMLPMFVVFEIARSFRSYHNILQIECGADCSSSTTTFLGLSNSPHGPHRLQRFAQASRRTSLGASAPPNLHSSAGDSSASFGRRGWGFFGAKRGTAGRRTKKKLITLGFYGFYGLFFPFRRSNCIHFSKTTNIHKPKK